jgi:hypothetical protein
MHRTQILLEPSQHAELTAIAGREQRSLSDLVREMLWLQLEERRKRNLAAAAVALQADYRDDTELLAFMVLDA